MIPYDATAASLFTPYVDKGVYLKPTDTVTSGDCAELSRLVYILFDENPDEKIRLENLLPTYGYKLITVFNVGSTQAMTVSHIKSNACVVVFRGSQIKWNDIKTDLTILPVKWKHGGFVHKGFKDELDSVWDAIKKACGERLNAAIFTGHSLGAAIATLAANEIQNQSPHGRVNPKLITFGSPAVGNADFVASSNGLSVERHVNCCDIVPRLPPEIAGFVHVGEALYFNSKGKADTSSNAILKMDRYLARAYFLARYLFDKSSVKIRDLADHAPINYVRLF